MLGMIEQLTQEIRTMDKEVERLSKERYKVTALFRQISGVRRDPTEKSLERQTEWRWVQSIANSSLLLLP